MKKFKKIISLVLSTAMVFTGSLTGFIPAKTARAETNEIIKGEYEEGRVIVCVQETESGAEDSNSRQSLFSIMPFNNSETAESLLAGAEELMDVSDAMEDVLSEENNILSEDEVRLLCPARERTAQ